MKGSQNSLRTRYKMYLLFYTISLEIVRLLAFKLEDTLYIREVLHTVPLLWSSYFWHCNTCIFCSKDYLSQVIMAGMHNRAWKLFSLSIFCKRHRDRRPCTAAGPGCCGRWGRVKVKKCAARKIISCTGLTRAAKAGQKYMVPTRWAPWTN